MTPPATARDILLKGAELLGEHGWCQGAFQKSDGSVCSVGAVMNADQELNGSLVDRWRIGGYDSAIEALAAEIGQRSIVAWNDNPERSAEDVILTFKRAAERLD